MHIYHHVDYFNMSSLHSFPNNSLFSRPPVRSLLWKRHCCCCQYLIGTYRTSLECNGMLSSLFNASYLFTLTSNCRDYVLKMTSYCCHWAIFLCGWTFNSWISGLFKMYCRDVAHQLLWKHEKVITAGVLRLVTLLHCCSLKLTKPHFQLQSRQVTTFTKLHSGSVKCFPSHVPSA